MADFKLVDVAKRGNMTAEEALQKLQSAGEQISSVNATISVEQTRLLGVDPQQMLDRRKERLQQARERVTRGTIGKEVVMNSRTREEPVPLNNRKISKEELQRRKSELNKDVQRVDEDRQTRQLEKDTTIETPIEVAPIVEEKIVEPIIQPTPEPVKVEEVAVAPKPVEEAPVIIEKIVETPKVEEKPVEVAAPKVEEPVQEPAKPAPVVKAPTPRPLGPAGYVPPAQNRRPATPRPAGTPGQPYQRPTGPAADRNKPYQRPTGPAAGGDSRGPRTWSDNKGGAAGGNDRFGRGGDRPTSGGQRPGGNRPGFTPRTESTPRPDEEQRRWEAKKVKVAEPVAMNEEAKKAKAKSDAKSNKEWNKAITEGISELNIESEIDTPTSAVETVAPVAPARHAYPARGDKRQKRKQDRDLPAPTPKPTHITIGEQVVVSELAGLIGIKATELVKKLFGMDIMATVNQAVDAEIATLLCMEYGIEVTKKVITEDDLLPVYEDKPEDLKRRPPVVTVMGHVDHGKTSLLDAIRSASVAEKEAGGITQHIGAYEVDLNGRKITFLDTPGHEAFTSLRARGAQVTDIVILVVAANDGVMPQTKEAIDHAKAAGVRIVVAVNKIDRPDANPDKVRQQLAEYGIISDDWGGEYQFQEISAKKRTGIEDLLERVLLEADVLELQGNPNRPAEGIIIESQLDKQKGPIATVLVKNGTLKRGDTFIVGSQVGKVRSMHNYRGIVVKEAGISIPVEVMGMSTVPESGDMLTVVEDEKVAKEIADMRARQEQHLKHNAGGAISLSDFFDKVKAGAVKELNIIIKADVQGSLEALKGSLQKLSNAEVKVNVVHDATGGINESDVVLAMASKAIIIGFNVRPDNNAKNLAEREEISIELYSIIYKAIEDVRLALEGMLTPETKENILGKLEIRQVFSVPKLGKIAGAYVVEGKVTRGAHVRVIRDNIVIYDGKLGSLKRFTDDVKEVSVGYECGLSIDKYQDIKERDYLEVYELVQEKRKLEDVK
ncbi:MAG: translation initiation factor IF-2 [Deferribacteraceae bacterium]|jgi:translation initiation factor IF-2|nr:translation initiation factor IF-2 [Deferribacteraceae bacterium]